MLRVVVLFCTASISLNLYFNNIGAERAKVLANALASGKTALTSLDLQLNDIGAEGAKAPPL